MSYGKTRASSSSLVNGSSTFLGYTPSLVRYSDFLGTTLCLNTVHPTPRVNTFPGYFFLGALLCV